MEGILKNKRNYGLDLLKIVAMIMVLILHMLSWTGALDSGNIYRWIPAWMLQTFSYFAVDCFVIITGYVLSDKEETKENVKSIQVKTLTFGILGFVIFFPIVGSQYGILSILRCFFPVVLQGWWFIQSYIILLLFIPYFNKAIKNLSNKNLFRLCILIFIVFSVMFTLFRKTGWDEPNGGSGYVLFFCLYFGGAALKRFENKVKISYKFGLIGYFIICITLFTSKITIHYIQIHYSLKIDTDYSSLFYNYSSILVVLGAVSLVYAFMKLNIHENLKRWIKTLSKYSLCVYLLHMHPILKYILAEVFSSAADTKGKTFILIFVFGTIILFLLGICTGYLYEKCSILLKNIRR